MALGEADLRRYLRWRRSSLNGRRRRGDSSDATLHGRPGAGPASAGAWPAAAAAASATAAPGPAVSLLVEGAAVRPGGGNLSGWLASARARLGPHAREEVLYVSDLAAAPVLLSDAAALEAARGHAQAGDEEDLGDGGGDSAGGGGGLGGGERETTAGGAAAGEGNASLLPVDRERGLNRSYAWGAVVEGGALLSDDERAALRTYEDWCRLHTTY